MIQICHDRKSALICYSQLVNATSQYNNVAVRDVQNGQTRWDRCSGETLLAPCTREKRLQRKIIKHYHWIGVQENIGMFSKSWSDCNSLIWLPLFERPARPMFIKFSHSCDDRKLFCELASTC